MYSYSDFCKDDKLHNKYFIELTRKTKCKDILKNFNKCHSYLCERARDRRNVGANIVDEEKYVNLIYAYFKQGNEIINSAWISVDFDVAYKYYNNEIYQNDKLNIVENIEQMADRYAHAIIIGNCNIPPVTELYDANARSEYKGSTYLVFDLIDEE